MNEGERKNKEKQRDDNLKRKERMKKNERCVNDKKKFVLIFNI